MTCSSSARHHGSNTYVKFLPSFLVNDNTALCGSAFTRSDVRKEYIIVRRDPDNNACITGLLTQRTVASILSTTNTLH